ncbi:MAG: hypothetical protein RR650_09015 [Comamonas sp.]
MDTSGHQQTTSQAEQVKVLAVVMPYDAACGGHQRQQDGRSERQVNRVHLTQEKNAGTTIAPRQAFVFQYRCYTSLHLHNENQRQTKAQTTHFEQVLTIDSVNF